MNKRYLVNGIEVKLTGRYATRPRGDYHFEVEAVKNDGLGSPERFWVKETQMLEIQELADSGNEKLEQLNG